MVNPRIETRAGEGGMTVVTAVFDLSGAQSAAAAIAVAAVSVTRYRTAAMSADDVLTLRELTALADELNALGGAPGLQPVRMAPARLTARRDGLAEFVDSGDAADYVREDEREPLALLRPLLWPLDDLCARALQAAL